MRVAHWILAAALAAATMAASAQSMVLKHPRYTLTLTDQPCELAIALLAVTPERIDDLRAGSATFKVGGEFALCCLVKDDQVQFMDERGERGRHPLADFDRGI